MPISINPRYYKDEKDAPDLSYYLEGLRTGNRFILSECITLVESSNMEKRLKGLEILSKVYTENNHTIRIGISGSPGVGKSTFVDYLTSFLVEKNHKIAILAIDPSSPVTGGSIMGDKTRMESIASHENIYIRPTSARSALGGIAENTMEAIHLCEASGYNIILVETVGVGQSEIAVSSITDMLCLLVLPGAGDNLQGFKRGITEMADLVLINKSDGTRLELAKKSQKDYRQAIHLFRPKIRGWTSKVLTCSATEKTGIKEIWDTIEAFFSHIAESGYIRTNRTTQNMDWFSNMFKSMAIAYLLKNGLDQSLYRKHENAIKTNQENPFYAIKSLYKEVFITS